MRVSIRSLVCGVLAFGIGLASLLGLLADLVSVDLSLMSLVDTRYNSISVIGEVRHAIALRPVSGGRFFVRHAVHIFPRRFLLDAFDVLPVITAGKADIRHHFRTDEISDRKQNAENQREICKCLHRKHLFHGLHDLIFVIFVLFACD